MARTSKHTMFPKQAAIQDALLLYLYENGGASNCCRAADTYGPLGDSLKLDASLRSMTRDEILRDGISTPYWNILIQAAREELVRRGDLQGPNVSGRGVWALTEQGTQNAQEINAGLLCRTSATPILAAGL